MVSKGYKREKERGLEGVTGGYRGLQGVIRVYRRLQ